MTNAVLYTSLDPSGPGDVSGTGPGITRLYNILIPCLVTGYGSGANAKPGQGWTLVHANLPLGFKLKAPDGVYYTFYRGSAASTTSSATSSTAPSAFQVYMSETLGDITVYPPVGANVRSMHYSADNNSAEANRHWISIGGGAYNTTYTAKVWAVVARGSQVLILYTSSLVDASGTDALSASQSNYGGCLFLGNVVLKDPLAPKSGPQNAMVLGGYSNSAETSTSGNFYAACGGTAFANYHTRLRDPLAGTVESGNLAACTGYAGRYLSNTGITARIVPETVPVDLTPLRVPVWHATYGEIGFVPGVFICPQAYLYRPDQMYTLLGLGATYTSMLTPVTIAGEPFYFIPTVWGTLPVSLLEKYWQ